MPGPAEFNRLELFSTHASQATGKFMNVRILMCETGVQSLSNVFQNNYGGNTPVEVFSTDTLTIDWVSTSPGWNGFDLDTPFQYSGGNNLIVEFRYLGHDGKTINARAAALASGDRCLDGPTPGSSTGTLMSFLTCMRIHYDSSELKPFTFGALKALFLLL
jgi:hypothetical protein